MTKHTIRASFLRPRHRLIAPILILLAAIMPLAAQNPSPSPINADDVIAHLGSAITWYRDVTSKARGTGLPSDTIFQDNVQSLAAQSLQLAFQSARAEAALASAAEKQAAAANSTTATTANPPSAGGTQQEKLSQTKAKVAAQIQTLQSQIASLDKQTAAAPTASKQKLASQRADLQGQLDLDSAMQDTISKMESFLADSAANTQGLNGRINELARSVPQVLSAANPQKPPAPGTSTPPPGPSTPVGLVGQALILYDHLRTMHTLDQLAKETNNLRNSAQSLRQPLSQTLRDTVQRGRALGGQQGAPAPGQPAATQKDFETLTAQFKQISDAVVPLSQEIVLLDDASANLMEWRSSIWRESGGVLQSLLLRIFAMVLALAVILVVSEIGRRYTFRYIHDPRRRRLFIILRRSMTSFLIAVVLILGFVSEFSSLATFAGFLTAGIAVSLQAVLLSVAAYFYLVGRYGVSVGDRISVAGVTGDVLDIGITRFYLVELAGSGVDLYPTGRLIMLSNSVFFQAATPLFKQIPGTEFAWHEIAFALVAGADFRLVQEKLLGMVNSVYARYKGEIERQHGNVERRIEIQLQVPAPVAQLQLTDAGLEFIVRFPVEIRRSAEIDDEITLALLNLIEKDAPLKAAISGLPKLRATIRG